MWLLHAYGDLHATEREHSKPWSSERVWCLPFSAASSPTPRARNLAPSDNCRLQKDIYSCLMLPLALIQQAMTSEGSSALQRGHQLPPPCPWSSNTKGGDSRAALFAAPRPSTLRRPIE
jgi:hypothetical protein